MAWLALLGFVAWAPSGAAGASLPEFCQGVRVRDDERPLKRMLPESPPPKGELAFGPRNLSMYALNFGAKVVLDGGHLGYRFAAKGGEARVLRLNWDVRAMLREVDREGRVVDTVRAIHRRLGVVKGLELLQFSFPADTPGLYRVDISFRRPGGRRLASYEEYFRVVPRQVKLRFAVSEPVIQPGATVYGQVLNLGTVPVRLRPGFVVERAEGSGWAAFARPPVSEQSVEELRWTLLGGEASPCVAFQVPADASLGAYRLTASALVFGKFHRRLFAAPFEVLTGSG